jgi:hypothetical protein
MGATSGVGFGLHEPPKMRKAMNKVTDAPEAGRPVLPGRTSSRGISPPESGSTSSTGSTGTGDADSAINVGSASSNGTNTPVGHHGSSPRGTLNVKLISARGLAVSNSANVQPEPYVVMQFEQNEFVSRAPHPVTSHTSVPFTTSTAQPMAPGNLTRSSSGLGVGTISRAFAEAMGRGKKKEGGEGSGAQTPRAEEAAGGSSWLGKPGPGDPVWKEEVSLYVARVICLMPRTQVGHH